MTVLSAQKELWAHILTRSSLHLKRPKMRSFRENLTFWGGVSTPRIPHPDPNGSHLKFYWKYNENLVVDKCNQVILPTKYSVWGPAKVQKHFRSISDVFPCDFRSENNKLKLNFPKILITWGTLILKGYRGSIFLRMMRFKTCLFHHCKHAGKRFSDAYWHLE